VLIWRNTEFSYGFIAILLHWIVAIIVIGLFILGLWMVDLNYYDPWYRRAPDLHKSIGVSLFAIMIFRLLWRWSNKKPQPLPGKSQLAQRISSIIHSILYLLIFTVMLSGYLISTADGRSIEVFDIVRIPATIKGIEQQEDIAGIVHLIVAIIFITLSGLHAMTALKHHFFNRDRTFLQMIGR
jgi:cytochrome b561